MEPITVLIKKYGNRRLFDTTSSRYVNLDDIAALIREGKDVHVIDAKSGQDGTLVTLTQIITEDAKVVQTLRLPPPFLGEGLRAPESPNSLFFSRSVVSLVTAKGEPSEVE